MARRTLFWMGVGLAVFGAAPRLTACATCFGASDAAMAQGMNMGILALLLVIGGVLGGIAAFFAFLAIRQARLSANGMLPQDGEFVESGAGEGRRRGFRHVD